MLYLWVFVVPSGRMSVNDECSSQPSVSEMLEKLRKFSKPSIKIVGELLTTSVGWSEIAMEHATKL